MINERKARGLDRLITFMDAVVAIAITLLVLPLVEVAGEVDGEVEPLGQLLDDHRWQLISFAVSFLVIARLWRAQHRLTETMGAYDNRFVTLGLTWLLVIVFVPFPTALLGHYPTNSPVTALYMGTIVAGTLLTTLATWHVARTPELQAEGVSPPKWLGGVATSLILVVATLVALLVPAVNYWALLALLLTDSLTRVLERIGTRVRGR